MRQALDVAGASLADLAVFDLYSCFPIAVFNICDGLGLAPDDPRGLTVTGGLPFFGGAGNNYSMHAIASMARSAARGCRARWAWSAPTAASCRNTPWASIRRGPPSGAASIPQPLQAEIDAWAAPALAPDYSGEATVETYTIDYAGTEPRGVVIGTNPVRAPASPRPSRTPSLVRQLIAEDPLGGRLTVAKQDDGRIMVTAFEPALATA